MVTADEAIYQAEKPGRDRLWANEADEVRGSSIVLRRSLFHRAILKLLK
ncbi:MAG: hypothetical protein ACFCU5_00775 [Pleurocapsa sp.]